MLESIIKKYNLPIDLAGKTTYEAVGCPKCNNTGYYDRIAVFEVLILTDNLREMIVNNSSTIEIREQAMKERYEPLVIDGIKKVINGTTTLEELNKKLLIY